MFFAKYVIDGVEHNTLYFDRSEFIKDTFSPDTQIVSIVDFTVHGKTYRERKSSVEQIAHDWDINGDTSGLYWSDMAVLSDWFYRNGKRYGLIEEFTENGFC